MGLDLLILNLLQNCHGTWADSLMVAITTLGNGGLIWVIVGVLLLFFRRWRRYGILLLAVLAISTLIGQVALKPLLARPRPFVTYPGLDVLIAYPTDFSLPSGHAMSSFASAFIIWRTRKQWGKIAYIVAALIAVSRVWIGVHYPSDVLLGALFGTAVAWALWLLVKKLCPQYFDQTAML